MTAGIAYATNLLLANFLVKPLHVIMNDYSRFDDVRPYIDWDSILIKMINEAEGDDEYNCILILTNFSTSDEYFYSAVIRALSNIPTDSNRRRCKVVLYLTSILLDRDRRNLGLEDVTDHNYIQRSSST